MQAFRERQVGEITKRTVLGDTWPVFLSDAGYISHTSFSHHH